MKIRLRKLQQDWNYRHAAAQRESPFEVHVGRNPGIGRHDDHQCHGILNPIVDSVPPVLTRVQVEIAPGCEAGLPDLVVQRMRKIGVVMAIQNKNVAHTFTQYTSSRKRYQPQSGSRVSLKKRW